MNWAKLDFKNSLAKTELRAQKNNFLSQVPQCTNILYERYEIGLHYTEKQDVLSEAMKTESWPGELQAIVSFTDTDK